MVYDMLFTIQSPTVYALSPPAAPLVDAATPDGCAGNGVAVRSRRGGSGRSTATVGVPAPSSWAGDSGPDVVKSARIRSSLRARSDCRPLSMCCFAVMHVTWSSKRILALHAGATVPRRVLPLPAAVTATVTSRADGLSLSYSACRASGHAQQLTMAGSHFNGLAHRRACGNALRTTVCCSGDTCRTMPQPVRDGSGSTSTRRKASTTRNRVKR